MPLELASHDAVSVDGVLPPSRSATGPPLARTGGTLRTDWLH